MTMPKTIEWLIASESMLFFRSTRKTPTRVAALPTSAPVAMIIRGRVVEEGLHDQASFNAELIQHPLRLLDARLGQLPVTALVRHVGHGLGDQAAALSN